MYGIVTRRKMNVAKIEETRERATSEFWPKLEQAPGFVSFTLIPVENGATPAVIVWESKAQADAFEGEAESWARILDGLGHQLETRDQGEITQHLTART